MASYNKIILVGNLTRNPETRQLSSGQSVTTLGLATNHRYKTANGDQKEEVCFVDVTVWGKQGENCARYLSMGSSALVEGRLRQDSWEDKESGQKRFKHSIVADVVRFLGSANGNGGQSGDPTTNNAFQAPPAQQQDNNQQNNFQAPPSMPTYDSCDDDDVPF